MKMLLPCLVFGPMAAALIVRLLSRRRMLMSVGFVLACAAQMAAAVLVYLNGSLDCTISGIAGFGIHFSADGFRSLYVLTAGFMWLLTSMLVPEYFHHDKNLGRYLFFNLLTLGAITGVFLSDDLFTTLIFFEIMSFTSYVWVVQEETPEAMRAGQTYLAVAVVGGMVTLMGLFILYKELGTLAFSELGAAAAAYTGSPALLRTAAWLTLFGFAAKAGVFPLHIWLPKAHPAAPAPASALLSGILTKSGVFGMIVVALKLMRGNFLFGKPLLLLGAVTMFLGAVLALFSVNLKRTLACSSISQIGFITVGLAVACILGEHGTVAAYGTLEHMVNHSLFKLCLFMCAGIVFMNLEKLGLNEVRGFGRKKPLLNFVFLIGAVSIGCIPPIGSGFDSKSLLHEGLLEFVEHQKEHGFTWLPYKAIEILFLISGGLTIAYMIKLYVCLFIEKNKTRQAEYDGMKKYMNPMSAAALVLSILPMPVLGLFGEKFMNPLAARSMAFFGLKPAEETIRYFTGENLKGAAISLAIGLFVYFVIVRRLLMKDGEYMDRWPKWLDLEDSFYRPLITYSQRIVIAVTGIIADAPDSKVVMRVVPVVVTGAVRAIAELPEAAALLLRRTVLKKRGLPQPVPVGTRMSYKLGCTLNRIAAWLNSNVLGEHKMRTDWEYVLDAQQYEVRRDTARMERSVSFGLILLCTGIFITIVTLLLKNR